MKTRKAVLKRIKITGRKKIMRRRLNLGHFNAKDSGNQTRRKRKSVSIDKRCIKKVLPSI